MPSIYGHAFLIHPVLGRLEITPKPRYSECRSLIASLPLTSQMLEGLEQAFSCSLHVTLHALARC